MKFKSTHEPSHVQQILWRKRNLIEDWIKSRTESQKSRLPIYCSVDIRHSGSKISVVDTNLFPSGFNNIHEDNRAVCTQKLKEALSEKTKGGKNILIVAEDHTRNSFYLDNINTLKKFAESSGFRVRIGVIRPSLPDDDNTLEHAKQQAPWEPMRREGLDLVVGPDCFKADLILLNNDLTTEYPPLLINVAQTVEPPVYAGWFHREKYQHLKKFNALVTDFCHDLEIDPWHLSTQLACCQETVLKNLSDREALSLIAKKILKKIAAQYQEHKIDDQPFIVIKTDPGTYGMGVVTITHESEIIHLNRIKRKKLLSTKGGAVIKQFILQEGIPTIEIFNQSYSEHTLYAIRDTIVGGFLRVNTKKGSKDNLNSSGMLISPFKYNEESPIHYTLAVLARLAILTVTTEKIFSDNDSD